MLARGVSSTHVIIYEGPARPYRDKEQFGRAFRKVGQRAGVSLGVTSQDLWTTAPPSSIALPRTIPSGLVV